MGKMSEMHAEIVELSTQELKHRYLALKYSPSKGVRDELLQEFMAVELDRRAMEDEIYSPYLGAF